MAEKNKVQYSVVVPVYNSEGSLKLLHQRLTNVFGSLGNQWELILVNDCSRDGSWKAMQDLANLDTKVTAINLTNNFGQHNAIMCGLSHANGDYAITMDDDLQHPPEEITKLIKTITAGNYNVVYGQYITKRHGWFRDIVSKMVNKVISKITGSGYRVTSFRIINCHVVKKMIGFKQYNVMIDVLIKDIVHKSKVGHCRVEHHSRRIGKSNYSFGKLCSYMLNMIFNYTLWPLRLAAILGLLFSFISFSFFIYVLFYYVIYGIPVSGWTSIAILMSGFSGITLSMLGMIGEYVGRIFLNINHKPQYFVMEVFRGKQK